MDMGMHFEMRLRQLCVICDQDLDDHADNCPQGQMKRLVKNKIVHKCPDCHKWSLEKNRDDYLECRKCREVFTLSPCSPYDIETLPRVIIFTQDDQALNAARFPEKGDGDFPIDEAIKHISAAVAEARKKARENRRRKR